MYNEITQTGRIPEAAPGGTKTNPGGTKTNVLIPFVGVFIVLFAFS